MTSYVLFFILTCGQITDAVLLNINTGKYWEGNTMGIAQVYKQEVKEGDKVLSIKVENNIGICS